MTIQRNSYDYVQLVIFLYGTVYVIKAFIVKQMIIKKTFATVQRLYIFYNNRTVKVPEVYILHFPGII